MEMLLCNDSKVLQKKRSGAHMTNERQADDVNRHFLGLSVIQSADLQCELQKRTNEVPIPQLDTLRASLGWSLPIASELVFGLNNWTVNNYMYL